MNLIDSINKGKPKSLVKQCAHCMERLGTDSFSPTNSIFYKDGLIPFCNSCIKEILIKQDFNWAMVDKLCQYCDIPFVPKEFERLHKDNGDDVFPVYTAVFISSEYIGLGWGDYYKAFADLKDIGRLEEELPGLRQEKYRKLKIKWGANYDELDLDYLEGLYEGMLATQNVNGTLQDDQALKLCKISLSIDSGIREGREFDKLLGSYDKLIKIADFTPKNAKNASDFESCGELWRWLEKRGWVNKFYDDVTRDIVDETMKNMQNFNQRLYTNEPGIGEEVSKRIEALKYAQDNENMFLEDTNNYDLEKYENEGFEKLLKDDTFQAEMEEED